MMKNNQLRILACSLALGLSCVSFFSHAANITYNTFTITGILEAKTCSFVNKTQTVDLVEVGTKELINNKEYGMTPVKIELDCPAGVSVVSLIPSGLAPESGDSTLFRNTGTAKNVGLRLYDNMKNIMKPDGLSRATFNPALSANTYTFQAGYARTNTARVTAGSFNAVVTLSLDYS
ncbi:fimbrial protein [Salmonella enterica subsp. enterica]|nr:fimbrial protein [Salmonella enterica subsp. enterica serovar Bonn]EBZ5939335.1 fimbrial protein [Salmonella enterica subsp. enterica serovar Muenchen]MLZ41078.1 fimbrial protein [Salmonella enterica subsp. enterica serovar Bonn]